MKNWILYWLGAVFLVLIVCIVIIIKVLLFDKVEYKNTNISLSQSRIEYFTGKGWVDIVLEVAKKNGNWKDLPLSDNFRKKYNEKDGILGKIEFDTIELNPFNNKDNFIGTMGHLIVTKGKRRTAYIFDIIHEKDKVNWVDDIKIIDVISMTDESGKEVDYRKRFNEIWKEHNIHDLIRGGVEESGVAVTEHFKEKYPYFLDIFIHYSPLSYNRISYIDSESDLKNNIAIFRVNSILECKRRKYRVKLILDKNLYLDDVEVELLDTEEYRGNADYDVVKLIYKNSNISNLKVKEKLLEEYNKNGSIFQDIDKMDLNVELQSCHIKNEEYICKYPMKSGKSVIYHRILKVDSKDFLEDVIYEKLDYDSSMTIEEAKEKYINENKK